MPRLRLIILDQEGDPNTYRVVLWADVPAARSSYYAAQSNTSAWAGALPQDITALQNGSVAERVLTQRIPDGSTWPQIQSFLEQQWQRFQDAVTARNPWIRYGTTWDGTTWTVQTGG